MQQRWTVEGPPPDLQPVGAEEPAERDGDENHRHGDVEFADQSPALGYRDCRHAALPQGGVERATLAQKRRPGAGFNRGRR